MENKRNKEISPSIYINEIPMTGKQIIEEILRFLNKTEEEKEILNDFLAWLDLETLADIYLDLEYLGVFDYER